MAHLRIEYSANLVKYVDIQAVCMLARETLVSLEIYPVAGLRVRAFCADAVEIADGDPGHAFADLTFRIGPGRTAEEKAKTVETLYSALEDWLGPRVKCPFALSLELTELNYPYAQKRLNTVRGALLEKEASDD